jgi:hypothetical protein
MPPFEAARATTRRSRTLPVQQQLQCVAAQPLAMFCAFLLQAPQQPFSSSVRPLRAVASQAAARLAPRLVPGRASASPRPRCRALRACHHVCPTSGRCVFTTRSFSVSSQHCLGRRNDIYPAVAVGAKSLRLRPSLIVRPARAQETGTARAGLCCSAVGGTSECLSSKGPLLRGPSSHRILSVPS